MRDNSTTKDKHGMMDVASDALAKMLKRMSTDVLQGNFRLLQ